MLARHALIVELDDGVDAAAQVADRVEQSSILCDAGHTAVRPPHQCQRGTCSLYGTAKDGLIALDFNAGAVDGLVRAPAKRDADVDGFRRASRVPDDGIFEQRGRGADHHLDLFRGQTSPGTLNFCDLLRTELRVRCRAHDLVGLSTKLCHDQASSGSFLLHQFQVRLEYGPFLGLRHRQGYCNLNALLHRLEEIADPRGPATRRARRYNDVHSLRLGCDRRRRPGWRRAALLRCAIPLVPLGTPLETAEGLATRNLKSLTSLLARTDRASAAVPDP